MILPLLCSLVFLFSSLATLTSAQSASASGGDGYTGYNLTMTGDPDSAVYDTLDTPANVSTTNPPPDVYLNASVHVGEIDITVSNLTAQINLQAQVLQLLNFNAGVDVSIDKVQLLIENVTAKVLLEARLENVVKMINDTLSSIDLNPVIATLGQDVGTLVNDTVGGLTGSGSSSNGTLKSRSPNMARSLELDQNILFSVNDYSGNTHKNRILTQSGSIIDEFLDNDGDVLQQKLVGSYLTEMTFNGFNRTVTRNGQVTQELQYDYHPFHGLSVVSAIFVNEAGSVVATQVIIESGAGGSSTIDEL